MLSRGGYEYLENKLMEEKKKKKVEEFAQFESTESVIDPPSHQTAREVEDGPHQQNWPNDV